MSPTRQAVMPVETLMGEGNSPVRHLRQIVVAEKGTTLKLSSCRSWISATSGSASKVLCVEELIGSPCFLLAW